MEGVCFCTLKRAKMALNSCFIASLCQYIHSFAFYEMAGRGV